MADKLRTTQHNARKGKNGVFSVKHNDRNFDLENSPHIDRDLADQNYYWHCFNRTNPEMTFEEAEKEAYEQLFREALEAKNARYIEQRHPERVQTMDDYRTNARTCPEETIMQIGTAGNSVDPKLLYEICTKQISWESKTFRNARILDVALHVDEPNAAPHMHVRRVWIGHDKDGNRMVGQTKALAEMGIAPPHPDQKYGRYNSAKITYTQMCREHMIGLCQERGLDLELTPKEPSRSGLELDEFKRRQEQEKAREAQEQARQAQEQAIAAQQQIIRLQQELAAREAEAEKLRQKNEALQKENEGLVKEKDGLQNAIGDLQIQQAQTEAVVRESQEQAADLNRQISGLYQSRDHAKEQQLEALRSRDGMRSERDVKYALLSLEKAVFKPVNVEIEILSQTEEKTVGWGKNKHVEPPTATVLLSDLRNLQKQATVNEQTRSAAEALKIGVKQMQEAAMKRNMNRIDLQKAADAAAVDGRVVSLEKRIEGLEFSRDFLQTDLDAANQNLEMTQKALDDERKSNSWLRDQLSAARALPDENRELRLLFPQTFEKMEQQKYRRELEYVYENRREGSTCRMLDGEEVGVKWLLREYRDECAKFGREPDNVMMEHLHRIEEWDRGWER